MSPAAVVMAQPLYHESAVPARRPPTEEHDLGLKAQADLEGANAGGIS